MILIFVVLIILAIAGVVAAARFGLFNYRATLSSTLSRIPLVSKFMAPEAAPAESYASLQQDNDNLRKQVQALTMEVDVLSKGSQSNNNVAGSGNGGDGGLEGDGGTAASGQPVFDQSQQQVSKDLANYYANMRAESAAAILDNQDPQMVSEILYEMNNDAASDILAAMDPAQAAKLLKLMASIDSEVKNQSSGDQGQ